MPAIVFTERDEAHAIQSTPSGRPAPLTSAANAGRLSLEFAAVELAPAENDAPLRRRTAMSAEP